MLKKLDDWVKIKPANTALLVIDMQVDFCSQFGKAAKRGKQITHMQKIQKKLEDFATQLVDKGILVIFTRFVSGGDVTPANLKKATEKMGHNIPCVKGSGGEELWRIKVPKGALVVDKPHYDAFAYTKLGEILIKKGIKNVLVTGVRTEMCVDATAKRAASEGYDSFMVSDLVATYDDREVAYNSILELFENYYGFVVTSKDILSQLNIGKD